MLDEIKKILCNKLAWGVQRTHGSFVVLNFGNPRLIVREPMVSNLESLKKRKVTIEGEYYLWIQNAIWEVFGPDRRLIASCLSSNDVIDKACKQLDASLLIEIKHDDLSRVTVFCFEDDLNLTTNFNNDEPEEQWGLYGDDLVFYMKSDGKLARETLK